jgi:hypothetical protein
MKTKRIEITDNEIKTKSLKRLRDENPDTITEIVNRKIRSEFKKGIYFANNIKIQVVDNPKVVSTKLGSVGYEIYVKAWNGDKQYGFGEDGSVEIERLRNYNFQSFLIEDENGTIEETYKGYIHALKKEISVTKKYREDLQESILQDISHTIKLVGKLDSKIEKGKVGKTVDTFNPRRVANTRVGTGYWAFNASGSFATWRASASPTSISASNASGDPDFCYIQMESRGGGTFGWKVFPWANFDTSSIPDSNVISSAVASIRPNTSVFAPTDSMGVGTTIGITGFTPADQNAIALADMNAWTSTRYTSDIAITSMSTSAYSDFTLNASGIAAINKTGNTLFVYRLGWDIDNTSPGTPANGTFAGSSFAFGTTNPQKLVVTHASAGGTYTPQILQN